MTSSDFCKRVHVGSASPEMDWQNGFGFGSDSGFDLRGIDIHRPRVDVSQDRRTARMDDRVDGGTESHGRGDHFITGSNTRGQHAQVHRRGARADGGRKALAFIQAKLLFKTSHPRAGADPAGLKTAYDVVNFVLLDLRCAEYYELRRHGSP